jgi:GT2 family glycosyltransferase
MKGKIGVAIITCNREHFLTQCLDSIPIDKVDEICVINDGDRLSASIPDTYRRICMIEHVKNLGVGKSKNDALKYLMSMDCDYIFLLEDDIILLDENVFDKYIETHLASGIHHFNYGPGSPFNRKQTIRNFDLHNRHLLDQHTEPNPRMVIDYDNDIKVSLFEHTVAMFSFFTKNILDKVGLIDDDYYNAWEHVDHTYRIIKEGYHPPFWYFADIYNSHEYITEAPEAIDNSSIANDSEQWKKNVYGGREIYKDKHGHYPNEPPFTTREDVLKCLKQIKQQ